MIRYTGDLPAVARSLHEAETVTAAASMSRMA